MNFGTPVPLLIGIILILIAVGLFFLDKFKPGYKRDSDTVYSILFLVVGILSLFQLNQDFLPSLQLMIFAGMLISLMIENLRRRTPNNVATGRVSGGEMPFQPEPVRGGYRNRDYERSSRYDAPAPRADIYAELEEQDEMMPPVSNGSRRQIRGSREERRGREPAGYSDYSSYSTDTYSEELPRERRERRRSGSSTSSSSSGDNSRFDSTADDEGAYAERHLRRKQLRLEPEASEGVGIISYSDATSAGAVSTDTPNRRRRRPSESRAEVSGNDFGASTRTSRRRPRPSRPSEDLEPPTTTDGEYVDYKPIKPLKRGSDEDDHDRYNFDQRTPEPEF